MVGFRRRKVNHHPSTLDTPWKDYVAVPLRGHNRYVQTTAGTQEHSRHDETEDPTGSIRDGFLYCLKVFVGVRLGLALLALLATALVQPLPATGLEGWPAPAIGPGWGNLFSAWERWDALWFLRIATGGYVGGDGSAAFFPAYPLAIRGLSFLMGGHPLAAALLISNLSYLGAMVIVYRLTVLEFDEDLARRSVLYMSIFPTSFFFFAPYSEATFLLFASGAFLAARLGMWPAAGIAGALAAATRSIGVTLALPLAIEAIMQARRADSKRLKKAVVGVSWSGVVVLGTLSYLFFWQRTSGDALTPLSAQDGWLREFKFPWESIVGGTREAFRFVGSYPGGYHQVDWLIVVLALAACTWVVMRVRPTYGAYFALSLLIPMSLIFGGRPFMSLPRFLITVFPMFWALAWFSRRFRAHSVVVAVSSAGLGLLTVLFVNWYYIF